MSDFTNRHSYNLILLGNSMISRMRREVREMDPFPEQTSIVARIANSLDRLAESLQQFDAQFKRSRERKGESLKSVQNSVLVAGFTSAMRQMNDGKLPEESLAASNADHSDSLGYRGGPFKVPDVLLHLSLFRKTGALKIIGPDETFDVEMLNGDVVSATSDNTPEGVRLGEILVSHKAVTAGVLRDFLERHQGNRERIGAALRNEELVTRKQLAEALTFQFQQLFSRCMRLRDVNITFRSDKRLEEVPDVRLDVVALLMEGAPQAKPAAGDRPDDLSDRPIIM